MPEIHHNYILNMSLLNMDQFQFIFSSFSVHILDVPNMVYIKPGFINDVMIHTIFFILNDLTSAESFPG